MKKLNKSVLAAFILTLVGALLVGGATLALFTDEVSNTDNTFASGTLIIELTEEFEVNEDFRNIAPGDNGTGTIVVKNSGTLDMYYRLDTLAISGDLFEGATPLNVTLKIGETVLTPGVGYNELVAGGTATIQVTWEFPFEADNTYQGTTGTLGLSFSAEQKANNTTPFNN